MIYCHTYVSAIFLLAIFCKINAGEIEENDTDQSSDKDVRGSKGNVTFNSVHSIVNVIKNKENFPLIKIILFLPKSDEN